MFRADLLSIIMSLNTVYTAIGICHTSYADCLLADGNLISMTQFKNSASLWLLL